MSIRESCTHLACRRYRGAHMHPCHINIRTLGRDCSSHSCAHMHDNKDHNRARMRNFDSHRCVSHACMFSSVEHTCARLSKIHPSAHAREFFDHPRTGGSTLTKTPYTIPIQAYPKYKTLSPMQEDMMTNLKLTYPRTTTSITWNHLSTHYDNRYK
jgi:hypothetical protein